MALFIHGAVTDYEPLTTTAVISGLYLVYLFLYANFTQLEHLGRHQAGPAQFPYHKALRLGFVDTFALLILSVFIALAANDLSPVKFAAFLGALVLFQIMFRPVIVLSTLTFHPQKEAQLEGIAPDLMQRARDLNCSVMVADPLPTEGGDEEQASNNINATAYGFGRTRSVVLNTDLIETFSTDAIRGTLAHEIAHVQHGHVWKEAISFFIPWLALVAISRVDPIQAHYTTAGFALMFVPLRWLSRRHEFQADRQAAAWVGVDVMEETIESLPPDTFESTYENLMRSHPTHAARKAALLKGQPLTPPKANG